MPTISVIVPVYKVEPYLNRCVQSILAQSYEDFELILVDDGSPDNCGAMCDAWAQKDSRIKVIHKENGGLSDARNAGIDIATGQYLSFVDSDDYIHPQMLSTLLETMQDHCADVVCCDCLRTSQEQVEHAEAVKPARVFCTSGAEVIEHFCTKYHDFQVVTAWNKLYKKNIFDGLRYEVRYNCEDAIMALPMYARAKTVVFIDSVLYYYYQSPTSIMRGNLVAHISGLLAAAKQVQFLKKYPARDTQQRLVERLCKDYIWNYGNLFLKQQDDERFVREFRRLNCAMRSCLKEVLGHKSIVRMQKLMVIAIMYEWRSARALFERYFR